MTVWKLILAYDGTPYHGWQVQPGLATVQGTLAAALHHVTREHVLPQGSGRTDTGVHALGQVASFALAAPIPPANLLRALNRVLPASIRVLCAEPAATNDPSRPFHARHSALRKTYEYRIFPRIAAAPTRIAAAPTRIAAAPNRSPAALTRIPAAPTRTPAPPGDPIDDRTGSPPENHAKRGTHLQATAPPPQPEAPAASPAEFRAGSSSAPDHICPPTLAPFVWDCPWPVDLRLASQAAAHILGEHNFSSFAAADFDLNLRTSGDPVSLIRRISVSAWQQRPQPDGLPDLLVYQVTGSGFLHHMVRNLVGTFVDIASGRLAPAALPAILAARDRRQAGQTAPPNGLFLVSVDYPEAYAEHPSSSSPELATVAAS